MYGTLQVNMSNLGWLGLPNHASGNKLFSCAPDWSMVWKRLFTSWRQGCNKKTMIHQTNTGDSVNGMDFIGLKTWKMDENGITLYPLVN